LPNEFLVDFFCADIAVNYRITRAVSTFSITGKFPTELEFGVLFNMVKAIAGIF